jgi:hypothetical protein
VTGLAVLRIHGELSAMLRIGLPSHSMIPVTLRQPLFKGLCTGTQGKGNDYSEKQNLG